MDKLPAQMTVIGISKPGGPEVLLPETRAVPVPGPGEILVKVMAAGVNRPDVAQRSGAAGQSLARRFSRDCGAGGLRTPHQRISRQHAQPRLCRGARRRAREACGIQARQQLAGSKR